MARTPNYLLVSAQTLMRDTVEAGVSFHIPLLCSARSDEALSCSLRPACPWTEGSARRGAWKEVLEMDGRAGKTVYVASIPIRCCLLSLASSNTSEHSDRRPVVFGIDTLHHPPPSAGSRNIAVFISYKHFPLL
jgi:hypothetical protein